MSVDVASLALRVDALEVNQASESLKRMQQAGADAETGLKSSTSSMVAGFQKVAAQAAIVYAAFQTIGGASKNFLDFDKSIKLLTTQLGDATDQTVELEAASKSLALTFGTKAVDQSSAFYEVLSAGITDTAEATAILTEANKLAIGGNAQLAVTIDGLTSIVKGYGDKVKSASDLSDTFFTAALAGKTTIEELASGLGRVVPVAEALDVSFDELAGSVAALTLGGTTTREAITGVRAILASVIKPSSEAADEAARLGLEFNSAAVKSKGFLGFLDDVKQKTGGSEASMALLFGGVESLLPALALTGNAGKEFAQIMQQMADKTGIAQASFEKMNSSDQARIDRFFATLNQISITLGGTLSSVLTPAAELAARALNKLFGAENLTAAQRQQQVIDGLANKLERMKGINAISPFDNTFFNKKDFDQLEFDLETAKNELQAILEVKKEITQVPKDGGSTLTPNDPPTGGSKGGSGGGKTEAISESQRFITSLQDQTREAGATGLALLELRAKYLGVADSAAPYIQLLREEESRTAAQSDLEASRNKQRQEGITITESLRTAEERYAETQDKLIARLQAGDISVETFFRGIEKGGDDMNQMLNKGNDSFQQLQFAIQGWGRQASDALVDFAISGTGSFSDFAGAVIKDIARMYVQMQLITPLLQSLPGLGFGGIGGTGSASSNAASSVFSGLFKGGRASGGSVAANSLYRVNELGPELLKTGGKQFLMTGQQGGDITPLSRSSMSGGNNMGVVVNLIESPGKGGEVRQKQTNGGMEIDVLVDQLVAKKTSDRGSSTNRNMRQNFGLTDNLVTR